MGSDLRAGISQSEHLWSCSYRLMSLDVSEGGPGGGPFGGPGGASGESGVVRLDVDSLPWFGSSESAGEMFCSVWSRTRLQLLIQTLQSNRPLRSSESQQDCVPPTVEQCGLHWGCVEGSSAH